jgi:hypothetical protein
MRRRLYARVADGVDLTGKASGNYSRRTRDWILRVCARARAAVRLHLDVRDEQKEFTGPEREWDRSEFRDTNQPSARVRTLNHLHVFEHAQRKTVDRFEFDPQSRPDVLVHPSIRKTG